MAHDFFVFIVHLTKTLETGVGKEIGNYQIVEVIVFENLLEVLVVWHRDSFTILILRINNAHINLNITLLDLKQGITILV